MIELEAAAREQLALCARALHRLDLLGLSGHVSLRIPDSPLILITPGGGLDKARLTGADLVTIDADGQRVAGPYPPPWETPIHTVIHAARPELAAVAHLHAHWATVWSVVDRPLEIMLNYATTLRGPIPRYDDLRWITTPELGQQLCRALGSAMAVLMRGHGITVVGHTLEEMFHNAMVLEDNARVLWEASVLGQPRPIPPEQIPSLAAILEGVRAPARSLRYFANLEAPADAQRHAQNRPDA
ncbi:MAG TPA: class II aldolase/adducin family protein [Chloroflexota bacterium]|nr:class II aldolase/adducin family protein [Chloroflexota bacterium]